MRRAGNHFAHDVADFRQLVHQAHLVVQASGGVDQHHVGSVGLGRGERVESHRCGVGTHLLTDHRRPGAVGPHLQLVDGRRAERVRRADPDLPARLAELRSQFADGRGLAGAVDAHDHHHVGLTFGGVEPEILRRAVRILHQRRDLPAQDRLQLRGVHVLVPGHALLDAADDLHGRLHAHVRRDEHLFEVVEYPGVDRRPARHGARQFREKPCFGFFQPGGELLLLFLRLLPGGRRILFLFENIEKCHVVRINPLQRYEKCRTVPKPDCGQSDKTFRPPESAVAAPKIRTSRMGPKPNRLRREKRFRLLKVSSRRRR